MLKIIRITITVCLVIIISLLVASYGYLTFLYPNTQISHPTDQKFFHVETGYSLRKVANDLYKHKIIQHPIFFEYYIKLNYPGETIKAGTYIVNNIRNVKKLADVLVYNEQEYRTVSFIRGSSIKGLLSYLHNVSYIQHTLIDLDESQIAYALQLPTVEHKNSLHPLEGWLLADDYEVIVGISDIEVLRIAHKRLLNALDEAWLNRDANLPLKNKYEMLILASLVEKESTREQEKPIIASVFVNRLKKGILLQTDPTILYGLKGMYGDTITRTMLRTPTAYNTYLNKGLPPTPISAVNRTSLNAVAHPATTKYLYFVASPEGGHKFNITYQQHKVDVSHYVKWLTQLKLEKSQEAEAELTDSNDSKIPIEQKKK